MSDERKHCFCGHLSPCDFHPLSGTVPQVTIGKPPEPKPQSEGAGRLGPRDVKVTAALRTFETGATRSPDGNRIDPEGYLSPLALERFSEYMQKHQRQSDGSLRASDNWQLGMSLSSFAKGLWRHFLHFWMRHRGWRVDDPGATANIQEDLCAIIFNAQGYLHELLKEGKRA